MPKSESKPAPLDESRALRHLLVRGLRQKGCRKLCKGEPTDTRLFAEQLSRSLLWAVLLGLGAFAFSRLGWSFWGSVGALALALLAAALFTLATSVPSAAYLLFVILWLAGGVFQLVGPGVEALLVTHAVPFAIVPLARRGWRALRLAAGIPLFLPVAFVVILSPLLSQDPWVFGTRSGWRIAALAAVSIVPLLTLVAARQLRRSVPAFFEAAAKRLSEGEQQEEKAFVVLKKLERENEENLDEEKSLGRLRPAYEPPFPSERAAQIAQAVGSAFKFRMVLRLVSLTVGVLTSIALLAYLLAAVSAPTSFIAGWTGQRTVSTEKIAVFGLELLLPLGPYVTLAALLAVIATVGFLAFALMEDRYSAALSEALVSRPAERVLLLALPYVALNEPKRRGRRSGRRQQKAERQDAAAEQR